MKWVHSRLNIWAITFLKVVEFTTTVCDCDFRMLNNTSMTSKLASSIVDKRVSTNNRYIISPMAIRLPRDSWFHSEITRPLCLQPCFVKDNKNTNFKSTTLCQMSVTKQWQLRKSMYTQIWRFCKLIYLRSRMGSLPWHVDVRYVGIKVILVHF